MHLGVSTMLSILVWSAFQEFLLGAFISHSYMTEQLQLFFLIRSIGNSPVTFKMLALLHMSHRVMSLRHLM